MGLPLVLTGSWRKRRGEGVDNAQGMEFIPPVPPTPSPQKNAPPLSPHLEIKLNNKRSKFSNSKPENSKKKQYLQ